MRTNSGELVAKPFGIIGGPYALSRKGEAFHRIAQALTVLWIFTSLTVFRGTFFQSTSMILFICTLIVVTFLSMMAVRNGRKIVR